MHHGLANPERKTIMQFDLLETERLLLKGISPEVMTSIFETLPKPEIKKLLGHRSDEEYLKEESKHHNGYSSYNRRFRLFLLTDKTTGSIIGRCGIHNWNEEHRRAEIGYVMHDEASKRKGLMTEAVGRIIDFGFEQLNLHRLEALVGADNTPSLRILEKFGFVTEGRLRQHYLTPGGYVDSLFFSLLKDEYSPSKS